MKKVKLALVLGLAVVLVSAFALPGPAAAKYVFRWGCANPGSYYYKASAFMADFLRRGMPDYDLTICPHSMESQNPKQRGIKTNKSSPKMTFSWIYSILHPSNTGTLVCRPRP